MKLYYLFAVLSFFVNITVQYLTHHAMPNNWLAAGFQLWFYQVKYELFLSLFLGTLAGLLLKYYLDKKYIFNFQVDDALHDSKLFGLYAIMGLATTGIFWGFQLLFDYIFLQNLSLRYLGGAIGFAIGTYVKYLLDRKFVFSNAKP
jgi:putative flippase GtrA